MRKIELEKKESYTHTAYFPKKEKKRIEEIMEEEGIEDYSEALRKCINFYYENREVNCTFCGRTIKVKDAFKVDKHYFCNPKCYEYHIGSIGLRKVKVEI